MSNTIEPIRLTSSRPVIMLPPQSSAHYVENLNEPVRRTRLARFTEEANRAKERFDGILNEYNKTILDDLDKLVEDSLDEGGQAMFPPDLGNRIYGAVLMLDMQTTDHKPTFDTIECHFKKKQKMPFLRIGREQLIKRTLIELLDSVKHGQEIFVLIERAELLGPTLASILIGNLKEKIRDPDATLEIAIVVSCLSTKMRGLSFKNYGLSRIENICRDRSIIEQGVTKDLMENENSDLKLDGEMLDTIYDFFLYCDASITSLELLYSYAIYEHYSSHHNQFKHKIDKEMIKSKKKLRTKLPEDLSSDALLYHCYICDQLLHYYDLIHDHESFPGSIAELYAELFKYHELAHSPPFVDAIKNIMKFPPDRIVKRIEEIESKVDSPRRENNDFFKKDVSMILSRYKEKLENNIDDFKEITVKLIEELLDHSQELQRPSERGFDQYYMKDCGAIRERSIGSSRGSEKLLACYSDPDKYYGIVYEIIQVNYGSIDLEDLFNEASPKLKELILGDLSCGEVEDANRIATPKKSRSTRESRTKLSDKTITSEGLDLLTNLIFTDVIESLVRNQIVKQDKRASKVGLIKRLVWL